MYELIDIFIELALLTLVVAALIKENHSLRITTVVILVFGLFLREFVITSSCRNLIGHSSLTGEMLDHYRDGISLVVKYTEVTSIYVIVASVLLLVLSIGIPIFKKYLRLCITTAIVLGILLIIREISITVYTHTMLGQSTLQGAMLDHYRDGALDMLASQYDTNYYTIPAYIVLVLLSIKGLLHPKKLFK